jgi:urease accessory protein
VQARARIVAERDGAGRTVVRELRSQAPLTLLPQRGAAAARSPVATVHLVGSASTPLGGDDVELEVEVGPGADLVLTGVAATLALPGHGTTSSLVVRAQVGEGAGLRYLPEPTIVTRRADHHSKLRVDLAPGARLRCREVLVAGRNGEESGRFHGLTDVREAGVPLLVQAQELGDAELHASAAHLAGRRVLGTELLVWGDDPAEAVAGTWWSLTPLPRRGALATAVGEDAVTTTRDLATAIACHPGWSKEVLNEATDALPRRQEGDISDVERQ